MGGGARGEGVTYTITGHSDVFYSSLTQQFVNCLKTLKKKSKKEKI